MPGGNDISGQWHSQGAIAAVASPRIGQRQKIIIVSVIHTTSKSHFSFYEKRSVG